MFASVETDIMPNILKHEPYFKEVDLDLDDLMANMMDDDPNNEEPDRTDFNFLNPSLLDVEPGDDGNTSIHPHPSRR